MSKIAEEIELRVAKYPADTKIIVENLFAETEWLKITELKIGGWLGTQVRIFSKDPATPLEFIGTTRLERFPRRMVAQYRVVR